MNASSCDMGSSSPSCSWPCSFHRFHAVVQLCVGECRVGGETSRRDLLLLPGVAAGEDEEDGARGSVGTDDASAAVMACTHA